MGYAVVMFGILLIMSVVMVTVVNYGIAKDSQTAPLKAKNTYAGIKTGQAQTGLTIVNTCLACPTCANGYDRYTSGQSTKTISGPYILYLDVSNNGSTILNSTKATILYNNSFTAFTVTSGNVWTPMNNTSMQVSNIYISTPGSPDPYTALRLLVAAENGVSAIAPTTPVNFNAYYDKPSNNYTFTWNASRDNLGIGYYIIYGGGAQTCPMTPSFTRIVPANQTSYSYICSTCSTYFFSMTAVDLGGNMAVQSRTLRCPGSSGNCAY